MGVKEMKDLKISTELASAVLGKEVTKCSLINKSRNSINITYFEDKEDFNTIYREWNIYEFAFKCKEWAYNQGYTLKSEIDGCLVCKKTSFMSSEEDWVSDVSEIEAVIKACEYILQQSKKGV